MSQWFNCDDDGKVQQGKSTSGNRILGQDVFEEGGSTHACTQTVSRQLSNFHGCLVQVLDTPGLFDPDVTDKEQRQKVLSELRKMNQMRVDVIFFVQSFTGAFDAHDIDLIEQYANLFKLTHSYDIFQSRVVFLFTRANSTVPKMYSSFQQWGDARCKEIAQRFEENNWFIPNPVWLCMEKFDDLYPTTQDGSDVILRNKVPCLDFFWDGLSRKIELFYRTERLEPLDLSLLPEFIELFAKALQGIIKAIAAIWSKIFSK